MIWLYAASGGFSQYSVTYKHLLWGGGIYAVMFLAILIASPWLKEK